MEYKYVLLATTLSFFPYKRQSHSKFYKYWNEEVF